MTSACSDGSGLLEQNAESASTDFDQQAAGPSSLFTTCDNPALPASTLGCTATAGARAGVLSVCGDLTADNTLSVTELTDDSETSALWVQGSTRTSAPLTVAGDFIAVGGNEARNTQSISGGVGAGPALGCERAPDVRARLLAATPDAPRSGDAAPGTRISVPTEATVSSCDYSTSALGVDNTLTLHVRGAVRWHILGDLRIAAPTLIELEPGASLELVVGGNLEVDNTLRIGDGTRPEATLLAVAGNVRVAAPTLLYGSLLAPRSQVRADNTLDVQGAAYVGSLRVAAPMVVRGEGTFSEDGCAL